MPTTINKDKIADVKYAPAINTCEPLAKGPIDANLIVGDSFTEQSGYIETKLLLRTEPGVRAILALSNLNALGAIRALTEEKQRIPEDVSMVSFDDTHYSAYLATPLTTVAQANSEMGEVAVKLLLDQIQSPHRQTKGGILLPDRKST